MPKKYKSLFCRVEYPGEGGYRMEPRALPDWLYLTVITIGDTKCLVVHSRIHLDKEVKMNPGYSLGFSDIEIIKDLSGEVSHRFGV